MMIKENCNPIGQEYFDLQPEFACIELGKNFTYPLWINHFVIFSYI